MAAPSGLIVAWPSTVASIPAGWSRVAALNSVHPKASATAGTTGGSATHAHTAGSHQHTDTHAHASGNSGTYSNVAFLLDVGSGAALDAHSHTQTFAAANFSITANAGAASSSGTITLSTYTVIWIQADGTTDIPSGAVMWWNTATAPTNWAFADGTATTPDLRNKYLLGAAVGADGGTSVAASGHTHTYSHSHAATAHSDHTTALNSNAGGIASGGNPSPQIVSAHGHTTGTIAASSSTPGSAYGTDATASDSNTPEPLYYKLLPIKKTAADATIPDGLIGLTVGATPTNFILCNGTGGTPNLNGGGYFIKGANTTGEIGTTGGAATHTHIVTHGHTVPAHTHSSTGTSGSSDVQTSWQGYTSSSSSATNVGGHDHAGGTSGAISGSTTVANNALSLPANTSNDPPYSTAIYVQSYNPPVAKASSENAAINVTESEALTITTEIAASENAAINVTEVEALEITDNIAGSENAAINVTEDDSLEVTTDSAENAAINITESTSVVKYSEYVEPQSERVRVELYSAAGAKLAVEPVLDILTCSYQQALNSIGAFSFEVPADGISSDNLAAGQQAWFYVKDEGLVFKGIIDKKETIVSGSELILRLSGSSLARKLVWNNTLLGRAFDNVALSSAMTTLLSGTGFTSGSLAVPSINLYARYDGLSIWSALLKVAEVFGLWVREDLWNAEVDVNSFGTNPNNLVFANVPQVDPEASNAYFVPIHSARVIGENAEIWNTVIPIGQDDGVGGTPLTLLNATRSSPYTVQSAAGPGGTYYYLSDSTSVSAYGERTKPLPYKDIVPQGLTSNDATRAANALYDAAATWLDRHKNPVTSYEVTPVGLKHASASTPVFQVGDKVRVLYRGVAERFDGTATWLNVDTSLYIMGYQRTFNSSGEDSWRMALNTVARELKDGQQKLVESMEAIQSLQMSPLPYILFGDDAMRLDAVGGIQIATGGVSTVGLYFLDVLLSAVAASNDAAGVQGKANATSVTLESYAARANNTEYASFLMNAQSAGALAAIAVYDASVESKMQMTSKANSYGYLSFTNTVVRIPQFSADPSGADLTNGAIWYNTTGNQLKAYVNSAVVVLA